MVRICFGILETITHLSVPEAMYNLWPSELKKERLSFGQSAVHQADTLNRGQVKKIELAYL